MSIEPRFEIGVDYDGVSPRHHQVNEIRNFSNDKTDRIFFPECGAFYTDTLVIKDINTGKELIRNEDYECMIIDAKATKLSGKEACGVINIINLNVTGVKIDYQFVGGLHMTGYYLLEQILKMYPNGASAIISFDDLINVPTEHDPAYHKQHVHEFFGTGTLLVWLERLRQGIVFRQENNLKKMYNQAQAAIDDLYVTLQNNYDRLKYEIQETFKKISIQTDEYILTDSDVNPAISRGYGEWQLITDSVLYGVAGTTYLIGSGGGISIGGEQIIRNCYIWKNIAGSSLTETAASVTADKSSIAEGETITFTVKVSNTPDNTSHPWAISGADSTDFTTAITGNVIIVNGEGTVTVTAKKDYITDGDKNYVFYLTNYVKARKAFVVLDTPQTSKILNVNFIDNSGVVLSTVTENQTFRLAVNTNGMTGKTAYLKWTFSAGLSASNFSTSFPDSIIITSNTTYLTLTTVGNLTVDVARSLKVIVAEAINEEEHSLSKIAIVDILDTSTQFNGALSFLDNNGLIIASLDEGNLFKIRLKTNGGVGRTVRFEYQTNKEAYEFSGLVASDVVKVGNEIIIPVEHFADYVTRVEPEFLVVKAYDGARLIAEGTLMFNDTSKTPNFQVMYSKKNDGSEPTNVVNEGEEFYLIFQVPGWVGSTTAPVIDIQYEFTGQPDLTSRVQLPAKTTGFSFAAGNNVAGVEWVNGNTLAIKCTAVANKAINGNAVFSFKWKTNVSSIFSNPIDLSIIDTSKPVLNASWSSSNTNLIPVTSVDEMTSLGKRNLVYLWINIDGNAATYQNLKLEIGDRTTASSDLITVFPQTLTLANGLTKHIVTIEIDNDFITEGNEILQIVGRDGIGFFVFAAEITIVDNSVRTTLTGNVSTSATEVVAPVDGMFSEWNPAYIIVNHPAFAFTTKLELITTDTAKLYSYTMQVTIPANATQSVITLVSANQRNTWGDHEHVVTYKRTFDGKDLTPTYSTTVKFKNDKTPPSISNALITTDVLGNDLVVGSLEEGKTYYAHATINNPTSNMVGVIGVIDNTDNGVYAGLTRLSFADNKRVLVRSTTESPTPIKMSTSFTIANDRKNNGAVAKLRLAYKIDWSSAKTVGQLYDESITVGDSSSVVVTSEYGLLDTSKTISISDVSFKDVNGADATVFNEGDEVYFHVTLTNATIGDVYSISHDSARYLGISIDRYSYHEFDSKDITITDSSSQTLIYKATLKANMITDTSKYGYVKLNNKTIGTTVNLAGSFTVNDTSKTQSVYGEWLSANDVIITSVNEGATFKLRVKTLNLDPGMTVKLTRISGRPLTDFSTSEVAVAKVLAADGIYQTADFNFTLKNNETTDAVNTFTVKWEVVELTSINGEATISVIDTSKTPTIDNVYWSTNQNGTDSITTAASKDTVYLIVKSTNVLKSSNEFSLSFQDSTMVASDIAVGSIEGTQLISMGTYNNSTGAGHTWYALKFV